MLEITWKSLTEGMSREFRTNFKSRPEGKQRLRRVSTCRKRILESRKEMKNVHPPTTIPPYLRYTQSSNKVTGQVVTRLRSQSSDTNWNAVLYTHS